MTREVHVFVCYNVLSFEAAVRLIHELSKRPDPPSCAVLSLFDADVDRLPAGVETWSLTPPMHTLSRLEKPFRVAAWFARVEAELRQKYPGKVHAYVPHPCELPGNHFVFSRRPGDTVDLLPDGLINYFPRTMRPEKVSGLPRYCVRIALECLAALRHGLRYRAVWSGHQTQYEGGHYATSWAFNTEGYLTVSGELALLPPAEEAEIHSRAVATGQRAVMFLDQELHQIVGPALEAEMRRAAVQCIRDAGADVVLYKAHPRGENRARELRELGLAVADCSGPVSAERVVAREGVAVVVGFYSTSLMLLSERDVASRIAVFPDVGSADVRRPALVRDARKPIEASGATIVVAGHSPRH